MINVVSPSQKAQHTAKWARTMAKWLVTYSRRRGAKWQLAEFGGPTGAESRGVVDLLAIRKDHREGIRGTKRGGLLEIVSIQSKGGSARRQTLDDIVRLRAVAKHHRAKAVVLATWRRGTELRLQRLDRGGWASATAQEIFG